MAEALTASARARALVDGDASPVAELRAHIGSLTETGGLDDFDLGGDRRASTREALEAALDLIDDTKSELDAVAEATAPLLTLIDGGA